MEPARTKTGSVSMADAARWRAASLAAKPREAPRFYAVIAASIFVGIGLDLAGMNAIKMLFWSAILNGLLAPPLVAIVVLLTSDPKVMGTKVNSHAMAVVGWSCAFIMAGAVLGLLLTL